MSEIIDLMDEHLDYEMDEDDDDEDLDNEILQLNFDKYSKVVEDVPKIELKELTFSLPMDVSEVPSSNEEKQNSDKPTSSLISSEKLESVRQVQSISTSTSMFSLNFHDSKEFWNKPCATVTKVVNNNNIVPTPTIELAQAEKVEVSSSIYAKTHASNELSKIADDVSSLTINKSNNGSKDIGIYPVDSIVNEQKSHQDVIQHTTSMLMKLNKQKSPPYENQNTNVNKQMPPQYKNLLTTCIPMKINKQKSEQKPLQYESQNTTTLSLGENSKKTASRRYPNSKRETSTNSQGIEPKRDQNYETVFHTKRNIPSLLAIKVVPPIISEAQTRPVINNSNNLTTTASPFIITALNGAQSSRKVLINPSFKGFANIVPIESRDHTVDVRESMKRNLTDEDLRHKMRKKHRPINYETNHSEVVQANEIKQMSSDANELKGDNESDELYQYRMEVEKLKLKREEFQRQKELRLQQVGVDAYNEDLCRI